MLLRILAPASLAFTGILMLANLTTASADEPVAQAQRPNLVFYFADELRPQSLGCMDADPVITPNIDRFAEQSVVCTNAVSNYPVCSPMRAILMTGKYPFSTGMISNCNSNTLPYGVVLRDKDGTFSQTLREAGYDCGYIGKWHLTTPEGEHAGPGRGAQKIVWDGFVPPEHRHGFNFWHAYNCFDDHLNPHYWTNEDDSYDDKREPKEWSVKHEMDVALDYIRNTNGDRDADKPFALFMSANPPHMPFQAVPQKYVDMYEGLTAEDLLNRPNTDITLDTPNTRNAVNNVKHYFAAVTGIDEHFGRLMQCLEEEGLADNTIVVFTSDHGEMMGSHDRMHKSIWYSESFEIPFLVRYPEHIRPRKDDLLISAADMMPTLLSTMGLKDCIPSDVEGKDLSAALAGEDVERPESVYYLNIPYSKPEQGRRGLKTARYTFVIERTKDTGSVYLFDDIADPYQMKNIADTNPKVVAELTEKLHQWLDRTNDPWER